MRTSSILGIAGLLVTVIGRAGMAQAPLLDPWPAPPKFDLDDNYSERETALTRYDKSLFDTSVKEFSFAPSGLGEKALEKYQLPATEPIQGRIVLAPGSMRPDNDDYLSLGLIKIGAPATEQPQVFYRKPKATDRLRSPHFSPDGKKVVLRTGLPPDTEKYPIEYFLWNIDEARFRYLPVVSFWPDELKLLAVTQPVYWDHLEWSPGSRYLSYVRGGLTTGYSSSPFQLCVLDTVTRRERLVMKDAGLSWSWTYHGQIVSSLVAGPQSEQRTKRPSVYTTDAQSGAAKKLFDGGYYAEESPDGRWIAFCDWPGELSDAPDAPAELKSSTKRGLFLWDKTSKTRSFIGEMALLPNQEPVLQWSPDGKCLYATEKVVNPDGNSDITYNIYKVTLVDKKMVTLTKARFHPRGYPVALHSRGISPDGKKLYFEWCAEIDEPDMIRMYVNERYTLLAIDTEKKFETRIARLTNMVNEHPDWDWHDDSGINPAFAAAQKIEEALPQIKAP